MEARNETAASAANGTYVVGSELDLGHVAALKDELLSRIGAGDVVADLRDVQVCDLAGLQLLWAARASARGHSRRFAITEPTSAVTEAALAYGLDLGELKENS